MTRTATNRRLIIKIQQRGGYKGKHAMIEHFARAVLADMCSTRLANTLRITIKMRKGIKVDGCAHFRDMSKGTTARSKHYTIEVQRDASTWKQLTTITHELQHVVQMAQGRLALRGGAYYWRAQGQTGPATRYEFGSDYYTRPWEIEARAACDDGHGLTGTYADLVRETIAASHAGAFRAARAA